MNKLTYFGVRGRTEPIRLMLAEKKVPYEQVNVKLEEWAKLKPRFRFRYLPVFETKIKGETKVISQSYAIVYHLARKYDLYGKTELDKIKCDTLSEYGKEILEYFGKSFCHEHETYQKKKEVVHKTLKNHFERLEEFLKEVEGPYFVLKDDVTFADFVVWNAVHSTTAIDENIFSDYPLIKQFVDAIINRPNIKEYLKSDKRFKAFTVPFVGNQGITKI